ncbi:MAG: hypothetical protein CSA22_08555 [Deltaproteobacteria bacterium]|nr:MAG: hypothetical protein CSA22_08555 [Deltaproteobacteria bacterium]
MEYVKKLSGMLEIWIWQERPEDSGLLQFARRAVRVLLMTLQVFRGNVLMLRASSLAYKTILGIVPLLAIAFSVLKGFGVHSRIEDLLIKYVSVGKQEIASHIISYISNTNFKAIGSLGLVFLLYISINMMSQVEKTFNDLWGVTHPRTWVRKITDYLSVLFISPVLMMISLTMMATFSSNAVVVRLMEYPLFAQFWVLFNNIIPLMGIWVAFTALYIIIPNIRVKMVPALIAGVVTGTAWEGAFRIYAHLNIGVTSHNKIYGTLAAFPVLLVWIYISWVVLLMGARLTWAIQHARTLSPDIGDEDVSAGVREHLAVHVMQLLSAAFHDGTGPRTAEAISRELGASMPYVVEVLAMLMRSGLVSEVAGEVPAFQPGRDIHGITLRDVHAAVRDDGGGIWNPPGSIQSGHTETEWDRVQQHLSGTLESIRMIHLVDTQIKG